MYNRLYNAVSTVAEYKYSRVHCTLESRYWLKYLIKNINKICIIFALFLIDFNIFNFANESISVVEFLVSFLFPQLHLYFVGKD